MKIPKKINDLIKKQLINHEGLKLVPYKCTAGKLTIGIGRNLDDRGITKKEALFMLDTDVQLTFNSLNNLFSNFSLLPELVQLVLIDMHFNLGPTRFKKFKKMISAVKSEDYSQAAYEMQNSKWYHQVKGRGESLKNMMLLVANQKKTEEKEI